MLFRSELDGRQNALHKRPDGSITPKLLFRCVEHGMVLVGHSLGQVATCVHFRLLALMCQHRLTYFFVYKLGVFHRRLNTNTDKTTLSAKNRLSAGVFSGSC